MTEDIYNMMKDRRAAKPTNNKNEYKEINPWIRQKVNQTKNKWILEQCEELHNKHDTHNIHKKLKEITQIFRTRNISCIKKEKLFEDNSRQRTEDRKNNFTLTGPPIQEREVEYTVYNLKNTKSPGRDNISAEIIKLISPKYLFILFNKIYYISKISIT